MIGLYEEDEKICKIGIIGGGTLGLEILNFFSDTETAQVQYVCDPDPGAPALEMARLEGIETITNLEKALRVADVDFIVEATESVRMLEFVREKKPWGVELVSKDMATLFYRVLAAKTKSKIRREFDEDFSGIRNVINTSLKNIDKTLAGIKEITLDLSL